MILTNSRLSAAEELDAGVVTQVVPDAELEAAVRAYAWRLASGPTKAFARSREFLLSAYGETLETYLEREARRILNSAAGDDGMEGITASLGKRKPDFSGSS